MRGKDRLLSREQNENSWIGSIRRGSRIAAGLATVAGATLLLVLSTAGPLEAREREAQDRTAIPRSPEGKTQSRSTPRGPTRQPKASGGDRSSRSHSGSGYRSNSRGRHRGYYGYGFSSYYRHYSPYVVSPYWYLHHYGPSAYGRPYGHTSGYYRGSQRSIGAVDLNVKPKKADVYLDGQRIGTAGEFDGFPGHLWLEPGRYQLILHREGFETVVREIKVISDVVIDVRERLVEGQAMALEEFPPAPDRPEPAVARAETTAAPVGVSEPVMQIDATSDPGRLKLTVQPADASVYLDGRFLGTGDELSRLRAGVMVDPGSHTLEIVRPGYATETLDFEVGSDAQAELVVELQPNVA